MNSSVFVELPDASTLWSAAPAILAIIAISAFLRVVMSKLGADSYEWAKRAVRRDPDVKSKDLVTESQDWDTRKIVWMWVQWPPIMFLVVLLARLPGLIMPPVLWHLMECLIYGYFCWRNVEDWTSINLFERIHPDGRAIVWGQNSDRRRATKRRMMKVNIVVFLVLILTTLGEIHADRTVAEKYCLPDLPGTYHRTLYSIVHGIPEADITDEQLRDLMRSARANILVKEGLCKR